MKQIFLLITIALSFPSISNADNNITELRNRLSGHRVGSHQGGGVFSGSPNTLEQFEQARKDGADIVEMDLRISKDGIPVIFHDEELGTWTNCGGPVREKTAQELMQCQYNGSTAHIPTFEDVLKWAHGRIVVDAEFKDTETIIPAVELTKKYQALGWTYFQAQGNREKYTVARTHDANVALLFAVRNDEDLEWSLNLNDPALLIIELDTKDVKPDLVTKFKQAGKLITADVWGFIWHKELFGAACDKGFAKGVDLAITNRTSGCVKQK